MFSALAYRHFRVFLCRRDHFDQIADGHGRCHTLREHVDRFVREVVVRGDSAVNGRLQGALVGFVEHDARGTNNLVQRTLHDGREVIVQRHLLVGVVLHRFHVIVAGIDEESTEEVRPRQVVERLLFAGNRPADDLGVQMVGKHVQQTRFDCNEKRMEGWMPPSILPGKGS